MPPDTAVTASPEPGNEGEATVVVPDPNELGTELSPEDEQAFVDRELGITDPGAPFKQEEEDGGSDDEEPGKPDKPAAEANAAPDDGAAAGADEDAADGAEASAAKETEQEAQAPQEVDTSDLWVEFTDDNDKTYKIGVNDPIPADIAFASDAQLAELMEARQEMKSELANRNAEHDKGQAESAAKEAQAAQESAWDAEIQDLMSAGLLEPPTAKPTDKNYLEDPAIQKVSEVFQFMAKQNADRAREGKQPITSFGTAFTLYSNDKAKLETAIKEKEEADATKKRGALIGGSSSTSGGSGGENLYKQGSAASIHDLDFSDLL